MKKRFTRLTALLLALLMLMSMAYAESDASVTKGQYDASLTQMIDDLSLIPTELEKPVVKTIEVDTTTLVPTYEAGEGVVTPADSITVTAKTAPEDVGGYQWMIKVGDVWAKIDGATEQTLNLTYAMAKPAMDATGKVLLRCRLIPAVQTYAEGEAEAVYEDDVTVTVNDAVEYVRQDEEEPMKIEVTEYTENETPDENYYKAWDFQNAAKTSAVSTYGLTRAGEDNTVLITINYLFKADENGNAEVARPAYTASLAKGSSFSKKVDFPAIQGYLPWVDTNGDGQLEQKNSFDLSVTNIQEGLTYNVYYMPTEVQYVVIHKQQNVDDDGYTEVARETLQGLTKSTVPEVAAGANGTVSQQPAYEGFYALLYEKPEIAADGSTVVEVYYDRNYYLMLFELDGGYGVEPIYARYGAPIGDGKGNKDSVGEPDRAGYSFKGWSRDGVTVVDLPKTMPAPPEGNKVIYYAVWGDAQMVDYTVVYWKENADDSGYSYWGQQTQQALAGSTVSGSDNIPTSITNKVIDGQTRNEKPYFSYNAAKTDKNVVVEGDQSTVVNVYYYRNTYTLYFRGISGTCAIEEHTHGTNCNSYLDCSKENHTHDDTCTKELTCRLGEHNHTDDCVKFICTLPAHSEHTDACLVCEKPVHERHDGECCTLDEHTLHDASCCTIEPHVHSRTCCTRQEHSHGIGCLFGGCPGYEHSHGDGGCSCTQTAHTHGDGSCTCAKPIHTHGGAGCTCTTEIHYHSEDQGCYSDKIHQHGDSCYGFACGKVDHTHTDACYVYTCSAGEEHTHTNSCYRPCTKLEHTHTRNNPNCSGNSTNNVIYVVTAKYEQNIADVWPTADKFTNITLNGWSIDNISSTAVSKRVNMTYDLCDTSDKLKYATAKTGGTKQTLYYMFESFDQKSGANGDTRRQLSGTWYDSDSEYTQVVNDGADNWGQKPIAGLAPVNNGVKYESNNTKVFLYYKRNRYNLSYHNVNGIVKTVSSIMYEQPLKDYKDSNGNLLSAYVPPYPSTFEPNTRRFEGWYTTPECYEGTKFDFTTAEMPNGDLTLYANWEPIPRKVEFYLDKESLEANTKLSTHPDIEVPHGSMVEKIPADPEKGAYDFVGWFYMDNGVEKAFDFANMPVTKDLRVYGKWSSNVLKRYTVYFKIQGTDTQIADPITGSGLAGNNKTFDAKVGDELYDPEGELNYQEGYFPLVKSHTMDFNIEHEDNQGDNTYTFWYVQKEKVPYTVYYVAETLKEGGTSLGTIPIDGKTYYKIAADNYNGENRMAVVTEQFAVVDGYMPDAYQKRLVLDPAEGAVNEIIFFYTVDKDNAYYKITHYKQNTDGKTYTEDQSTQKPGPINMKLKADDHDLTFDGFEFKIELTESEVDGTTTVVGGNEVTLTSKGLHLKLYYNRIKYPYKVRYLEEGTGKVLATEKTVDADGNTLTGLYGATVTEEAIDIANYDLVGDDSQSIAIIIEESQTEAKLNIITFYYKEKKATINYEVVGPTGCGTVNPTNETLDVLSGKANGSTATASGNAYKFVGWYADKDCKNQLSTNATYVPTKADGTAWVNGTTYYAKFDWNISTLTITKTGMAAGESAIFTVKAFMEADPNNQKTFTVTVPNEGSVTIHGVIINSEYTVTELGDWTWRYTSTATGASGKIAPTGSTAAFTNTTSNNKWLDDEYGVHNEFNVNGQGTKIK